MDPDPNHPVRRAHREASCVLGGGVSAHSGLRGNITLSDHVMRIPRPYAIPKATPRSQPSHAAS